MATKHDSTRAQANLWVAQQNLARMKGARPYQSKPRKKPVFATAAAPVTEAQQTDTPATPPAGKTEPLRFG